MKLTTILLPKCPKCGRLMNVVRAKLPDGRTLIFKYCPDSRCRYAEEIIK